MMSSIIHIGDADGLIALLSKKDANHGKARDIVQKAVKNGEKIIFPSTAVTEAITTLQVRLADPRLAKMVAGKLAANSLPILPIDSDILAIAASLYDPDGSKKNTMFDAVVAATARKLGTKTIFSFDKWYTKIGLILITHSR